ncbi:nucleotide disphospho-sugar-binding domain-containing protein [Actinokineospora sp.]|uniref:nucleotide disphospho-sugar-binding domain-containing protein n=1 Tax=Actinokineospora sp. TaxID=1872133 RepID=UPI004038158B
MRLLFTTAPLRGQFFPLVPLAWAARALGHEVLVATTDNLVPTVLRSGLPAVSWGPAVDFVDLVADTVHNTVANNTGGSRGERNFAHGRAFGAMAGACLAGARSLVVKWRPDLLVCERAEYAGPIAARENDVPSVQYQWGVAPLAEYPLAVAAELADELGGAALPDPIEVLNAWPPGMRLPHAVDHHGLRAVAYNGDALVPSWVLEPRTAPRVCVSFGTVAPRMAGLPAIQTLPAVLDGLARLGVEPVVAMEDEAAAGLPAPARAGARFGRLPLAQVLPTCDLVVNHGGQGTVLTALAAGCPQLVLPQFDDQFDNADAVRRAGAGMSLTPDEATAAAVVDRCAALLENAAPTVAAAGRVAEELAALPSPVEVVDQLEKWVGR